MEILNSFAGVRAAENLKNLIVALGGVPSPGFFSLPTIQNQFDESGELKEKRIADNFEKSLVEFEWYATALNNHRKVDPSIVPKAVRMV